MTGRFAIRIIAALVASGADSRIDDRRVRRHSSTASHATVTSPQSAAITIPSTPRITRAS
jgi:hypothetical protein